MEEVRGAKITVRFDGSRCIHSRHCVLDAPEVFVANAQGDWIRPDAASVEKIVRIAHACPSGAITYERADGQAQESAPLVNVVRLRENGPLAFSADLRLSGRPIGYRATLCRCGASNNKPFCDGSHTKAAFVASGEPASGKTAALAGRDGTVELSPQKDGPLQVDGNLEVCSGTGRTIERTTRTWLCRCGGSANKPFCDGTHKRIGFRAE